MRRLVVGKLIELLVFLGIGSTIILISWVLSRQGLEQGNAGVSTMRHGPVVSQEKVFSSAEGWTAVPVDAIVWQPANETAGTKSGRPLEFPGALAHRYIPIKVDQISPGVWAGQIPPRETLRRAVCNDLLIIAVGEDGLPVCGQIIHH